MIRNVEVLWEKDKSWTKLEPSIGLMCAYFCSLMILLDHAYICIFVCVWMCVRKCMCIYKCKCMCMCVCVCVCMCTCMCMCVFQYMSVLCTYQRLQEEDVHRLLQ